MDTAVNLWPLIGVVVIIAGFILRFNPMLVVTVAAIASYSEGQFWGLNPIMQLAAILVGSVIFYSVVIFTLLATGQPLDLQLAMGRIVLPGLFMNLILALPTVQLTEGLHNWLNPPRVAA